VVVVVLAGSVLLSLLRPPAAAPEGEEGEGGEGEPGEAVHADLHR